MSIEHLSTAADFLFINRLQLLAFPAERLAAEVYLKPLPRRMRPYHTTSVDPEYVNICRDGLKNMESINCITSLTHVNEY